MGLAKTLSRITDKYWWPTFRSTVEEYVATCDPCRFRKPYYGFKKAPAQLVPLAGIFEHIHMDCVGPLPLTRKGNQYITVFTCRFSRWVEAVASTSIDGPSTARMFYEEVITWICPK